MMAEEGSESLRKKFGKFIFQHKRKTIKLIRKLERFLIKLFRQHASLLLIQTHTYIYIYIYIYEEQNIPKFYEFILKVGVGCLRFNNPIEDFKK